MYPSLHSCNVGCILYKTLNKPQLNSHFFATCEITFFCNDYVKCLKQLNPLIKTVMCACASE